MMKNNNHICVKSVNLFSSGLPMRANLKQQELNWQKFWTEKQLLIKIQNQPTTKKFVLHAGPPYANGNLHMGHAMNIILKDFVLRFYRLENYQIEFIPGWDTHGLPIANAILKTTNIKSNDPNYRLECKKYALQQVKNQTKQFQRLGLLIDWKTHYLTCQKTYLQQQLNILAQMVDQNLLYYDVKPVFWSWSSKTALAETEIIYKNHQSTQVYVAFPIINNDRFKNTYFLVWTTTPWTLVANCYLAINPKIKYVHFQFQKRFYIVTKSAYNRLGELLKWNCQNYQLISGTELVDLEYQHCYLNYRSKVLAAPWVESENGTGIVHVAPAFGIDDFELVQKITKKQIVVPLNEIGVFNQKCVDVDLHGKFYQVAEKIILKKIIKANNLLHQSLFNHQYPHDWRTNQPVVYRATKQLFVNLLLLKPRILIQIKRSQWVPKWGKKRLENLIVQRKNWCLSRQRRWGTPIPLFFNQNHQPVLMKEIILYISQLFVQYGDDIWWNWSLEQLLPKNLIEKYKIISKSTDTLDIWFDSGCSLANLYPNEDVDLIWEGNDQFRGWFNSLMIVNAILNRQKILKTVSTHGFVNDIKGEKMSKSLGNIVDPVVICQNYGADILRLWVASTYYYDDVNIGKDTLIQISQNYRKIRNTFRFMLDNLVDFQPKIHQTDSFNELDEWILAHTKLVIQNIKIACRDLNFHIAFKELLYFCNKKLSQIYFDFIKNDLYLLDVDDVLRRQHQTVLWMVYQQLLAVITILIPHTAEEIYQLSLHLHTKPLEFVHLLIWPEPLKWSSALSTITKRILFALKWDYRFKIRALILSSVEQSKKVQTILNAHFAEVIFTHNKVYQLFSSQRGADEFLILWKLSNNYSFTKLNELFLQSQSYYFNDFKNFLGVSKVTQRLINGKHDEILIKVSAISGKMCKRCRIVSKNLINNLCINCAC